jgi:hypothetical protein
MEVDEQGGLGGQGTSAIVSERSGGAPAVGDGGSTAGNGERERERERERETWASSGKERELHGLVFIEGGRGEERLLGSSRPSMEGGNGEEKRKH